MAKEKKDRSALLPFLFLLLSGFFVFLFLLPESGTKTPRQKSREEAEKFEQKVNRHLFQTSQKMELEHERAKVEAAKLSSKGLTAHPYSDPEKTSHPLDLSTDVRVESLAQVLDREAKASGEPKNPSDLIQSELFEAQQLQSYTEDYKKAYAQQFIENAKKAGYLVRINEQFKVISVQPLRKPSVQYNLFDSKGTGIQ